MAKREWVVREHCGDLLIGENVDGGHLIATLPTGYRHPAFAASQRKNAQIMAAAPELLESLQKMIVLVETICPIDWQTKRKARAAIKKATGQ